MTTENGIKEAITNLKDNVKTLSEHVHDLETNGCATRPTQEYKITKLEGEVKDMKEKLDELRTVFYKLIGAAVVLMWIGSFIANMIAKKL